MTGKPENRVLNLEELEDPGFRSTVADLESIAARVPGTYLHPSKRWEYPWALERAGLLPNSRILDAGCGASVFPFYLAGLGHRVLACDLDLPGPAESRPAAQVGFVQGELTELPLGSASFDTVFCISVIEHLPRERVPAAMAEIRRVLRPGGRLLLTTDFYQDAKAELWYEGPGAPFRVDWQVFDEKDVRRFLLGAEGFRVAGQVDLTVDWNSVRPTMRRFHGYPYTAVGISLKRV